MLCLQVLLLHCKDNVLVKMTLSGAPTFDPFNKFNGTYEPEAVTATFNMNGHGTQISAQPVAKGRKVTKPADPQADGWTFVNWYSDSTCQTPFDFDEPLTANCTIYAKRTEDVSASVTPCGNQCGCWTEGNLHSTGIRRRP